MRRNIIYLFVFLIGSLFFYSCKVNAILPLSGKVIVIDPGHGAKDPGTVVNNIYEKDINLSISLYLEKYLSKLGATVILTRDGDYDLSSPNAYFRKKSDFDNRIKLINESNAQLYLSIHLNYLSDSKYYGPQVFYLNNENLASCMQEVLNKELSGDREIKKISNDIYMYNKINIDGLLIECGFLSNSDERNKLKTTEYQEDIAIAITKGLIEYYN